MKIFQRVLQFLFGAKENTASVGWAPSAPSELTMTRVYDVGRQKVWDMWTRPEKLTQWWGVPPIAATLESTHIDLRVGGRWQADMINEKDGSVLPFRGTYLEIEPPKKLVFTIENQTDPASPDVEMVTLTLLDKAGTTHMTLHQTGHLPSEQYGEPLQRGYDAFFERLAKYLRLHQD